MATLYRPTFTKPIPAGAEIITRKGERIAKWKDRRGKTRTATVTTTPNGDRLAMKSSVFYVRYRDGAGVVRNVPTECRDEVAAQGVMKNLLRRAELVKAGVMTAADDAAADHSLVPLNEHLTAFYSHLEAKGTTDDYRNTTKQRITRLVSECGFGTLGSLRPEPLEKWLVASAATGMGARSRNGYREAMVSFGSWCMKTQRLQANPFLRVPKADEASDPRRPRRALTEAELTKLLAVAHSRPLQEKLTVRRGKRKGERSAELEDSTRQQLERLGRERALIYKTYLLTGLRKSELASITTAQVILDDAVPHLVLHAADEKNRKGATIPLRDDLAADIRMWLGEELAEVQAQARRCGDPIPLSPSRPVARCSRCRQGCSGFSTVT